LLKDRVSQRHRLYLSDLHFHTNYSDNTEAASIEEMILEGKQHNISIFGTGDHNHSFDLKKWRDQKRETACLRKKYPSSLILNNCEITFLLGHFQVIEPKEINGTILEGYTFLYGDRNIVKIINHPFSSVDEWHARILLDAAGIEVINGEVFHKAKRAGLRFRSAIDIPSVQLYAKYLLLDIPVAAVGSSDAHEKTSMGSGMTGFWFPAKPGKRDVIRAIRDKGSFATTDPGIALKWKADPSKHLFSWQVEWKPARASIRRGFTIEIYNRDSKISEADGDGFIEVKEQGLYWLAVHDEDSLAVSSPVRIGSGKSRQARARRKTIPYDLVARDIKDMRWLALKKEPFLELTRAEQKGSVEIELLSSDRTAEIFDADNQKVIYETVEEPRERVVIDKRCDAPCFDEFFLWLERNEIHEYMFMEIEYRTIDGQFVFEGILVPAKMVFRKDFGNRYREEAYKIRRLVGPATTFRLYVRTLFRSIVRIDTNDHPFPMTVADRSSNDLRNMLILRTEVDGDCSWLNELTSRTGAPHEHSSLRQSIYQVFL
jgi:hypothetical protein